ncbi:MAG: hypothetical protein K2M71_09325, partial [Duncaniella sp.]|nr:hypothetical protein [Duncaniella sp.]
MKIRNKAKANEIKQLLFEQLKEERAFWSYNPDSIAASKISDEQLIALTMRYLDLPEINQLFLIFPKHKIKAAWQHIL